LEWTIWVYILAILVVLRQFGVFYLHWEYFVVIWYIFSHFGMLQQEKSGNPGRGAISEKHLQQLASSVNGSLLQ
jgi:hypothetical protein